MRSPVFQKIEFNDYGVSAMMATLDKVNLGEVPVYWQSDIGHREELENFLSRLFQLLDSMKVNPKFPYPFYIVTDLLTDHFFFPVVARVDQLPVFFNIRAQRLTAKEIVMANKCALVAEKIRNLELEEKLRLLQFNANISREINLLALELEAVQTIAKNLDLVRAEKKV